MSGFDIGDRVTGPAAPYCRSCNMCTRGQHQRCLRGGILGSGPAMGDLGGAQSEMLRVPWADQTLVTVPDNVSDAAAIAVGDVLATGWSGVLQVDPAPGDTLVVIGAGPVGLSAVHTGRRLTAVARVIAIDPVESRGEMARRLGADVVLRPGPDTAGVVSDLTGGRAVDRNAERLELAKELGATHTVLADGGSPAEQIKEITGQGVQYALETTGVPAVFTGMMESVAARGTAGVVGAAALGTSASFDIGSMLPMGVTIKMIVEGESIPSVFIPQLMELHRAGLFPFDRLVKTYPFEQINEAFEDSAKGTTLKPVVVFP